MAPSAKKKVFSVRGGKFLQSENWEYFRALPKTRKKWLFFKKMMPRNEIGKITKKAKLAVSFQEAQKLSSSLMSSFSMKKMNHFPGKNKKLSLLKRKHFSQQNFWFVKTAAPIPGVSRLGKQKALFGHQKMAFDCLSNWLPFLGKKHLKQILLHSSSMHQKNWNL